MLLDYLKILCAGGQNKNCIGAIKSFNKNCYDQNNPLINPTGLWFGVSDTGEIKMYHLWDMKFTVKQVADGSCVPQVEFGGRVNEFDGLLDFIKKVVDGSETKISQNTSDSICIAGSWTTADPYTFRGYKVEVAVAPDDSNNCVLKITNHKGVVTEKALTRVFKNNTDFGYYYQVGSQIFPITFSLAASTDPNKKGHIVVKDSQGIVSEAFDIYWFIKNCILDNLVDTDTTNSNIIDVDLANAIKNLFTTLMDSTFDIAPSSSDPTTFNVTLGTTLIDTFNICAGALKCYNDAITVAGPNDTKTALKNFILACLTAWLPANIALFNLNGTPVLTGSSIATTLNLLGNQLQLLQNGVMVGSADLTPFAVDINVASALIQNPSAWVYNFVITETDGTTHSVALGSMICSYLSSLTTVVPLVSGSIVWLQGWVCVKYSLSDILNMSVYTLWFDSGTGILTLLKNGSVVDTEDLTAYIVSLISANQINTPFTPIANGVQRLTESGATQTITFQEIDSTTPNPKMQVLLDGTVVYTQPINKNDIQINNAGSEWDMTDDIITILETNWDTQSLNFSKYNVTVWVDVNWNTVISQNWVSLTVIKQWARSWLSVDSQGKDVLGQDIWEAWDPAKLLSDREIPMDGKKLYFKRPDGSYVEIRDTQALLELQSTGYGWGIFQKNPTTWAFYAVYVSDWWEWVVWDEVLWKTRFKINPTKVAIVNTDTTEFQFKDTWEVFFQKVAWIPISSASTVETMWIDTATGQLVRKQEYMIPFTFLVNNFGKNLNTWTGNLPGRTWDLTVYNVWTIPTLPIAPVGKKWVLNLSVQFSWNASITSGAGKDMMSQIRVYKNGVIGCQSNGDRLWSSTSLDFQWGAVRNIDLNQSWFMDVATGDVIEIHHTQCYPLPVEASFNNWFHQLWANGFIYLTNI